MPLGLKGFQPARRVAGPKRGSDFRPAATPIYEHDATRGGHGCDWVKKGLEAIERLMARAKTAAAPTASDASTSDPAATATLSPDTSDPSPAPVSQ